MSAASTSSHLLPHLISYLPPLSPPISNRARAAAAGVGKELTRPAAHRERSRQPAAHGGGAHWVAVLLGGTPGRPCAGIGIIGRLHVGGGGRRSSSIGHVWGSSPDAVVGGVPRGPGSAVPPHSPPPPPRRRLWSSRRSHSLTSPPHPFHLSSLPLPLPLSLTMAPKPSPARPLAPDHITTSRLTGGTHKLTESVNGIKYAT